MPQLRKEFQVHLLTDEGIALAKEMAQKFSDLASWVESVGIIGAESQKAIDHLETACFFSKKAMAQKHCKRG